MEINGEYLLEREPETVWANLHDTALLERCIPGCERVEWVDSETVEASLVLRVGTLRRRYAGRVRIAAAKPYESYTLLIGESGQGSSVTSHIRLERRGQATAVCYAVEARLDGYLARLGTPVARTVARRLAERFFKRLESDAGLAAETSLRQAVETRDR